MKIFATTFYALLVQNFVASQLTENRLRSTNSHPSARANFGKRNTSARRRGLGGLGGRTGGGGLQKMSYIMDFRNPSMVSPPTRQPTRAPVAPRPTRAPTTLRPTSSPQTARPTPSPTSGPTKGPTKEPTSLPTSPPSSLPTAAPSPTPTRATPAPTEVIPASMPEFCYLESVDLDSLVISESVGENGESYIIDITGDGFGGPGDLALWFNNTGEDGDGVLVASTSGRCTVLVTPTQDNVYCTMDIFFSDLNAISLQGYYGELIVVGGTGCYSNFTGFVEATLRDGTGYDYTIQRLVEEACERVYENPLTQTFDEEIIDWDSNGSSPGDFVVFDNNTIVSANGNTAFVEGECTILVSETYCLITIYALQDVLTAQGPADRMVITGAVGCFFGLTGSVITIGNERTIVPDTVDPGTTLACLDDYFSMKWVLTSPTTVLADYDDDGSPSIGDIVVFDGQQVQIPSASSVAIMAGRCSVNSVSFGENGDEPLLYCSMVLELDSGSIVLQGELEFGLMIIVGGNGCFSEISGYVLVGEAENSSAQEFSWSLD